ncbi:hypothetical protein EDF63_1748 [Curtobacterium sp. JUb34]|uniref:DUF6412 domain-containing protein n=1 Tax=Curtobacterium sp. JUb34 TaxID=2485109 RepID=UPI000F478E45|nr:DUF6412 domain-containing protein [Curtobacterium sp. JUb34]ROR33340.1 hypothetical protein EDF63_1748 [Curtobacterium sp. JUb34]
MTVALLVLRAAAALVLGAPAVGDPAGGVLPLLAVAALGLTAVAVAVLVAQVLATVLAAVLGLGTTVVERNAVPDLVTRIAWSHPDADGHVRSRAPGVVAPA